MATLNFLKGKRLAVIDNNDGPYDGETVFLYDPDHKCCPKCSDNCKKKQCCSKCSKYHYHTKISKDLLTPEITEMIINKNKHGINIEEFEVIEKEHNKSILLNGNGKFQQSISNMPFTQPDCIYISGRRGSGKSFYIVGLLKEFIKYYPKYRIYLFTAKEHDELFEQFKIKKIDVSQVKNAEFRSSDFKESLVIFDDVDSLPDDKDKNYKKPVYDIMTDIIETGRSMGIFTIVTSHLAANSGESKRILNGCSSFTFFLASSSHQTEYTLKHYFGFSPKQIKKILAIDDSRWVTVFRECPQILLTQNKIMFQSEIEKLLL